MGKLLVYGSNVAHSLFLYNLQARNVYYICKWVFKKEEEGKREEKVVVLVEEKEKT